MGVIEISFFVFGAIFFLTLSGNTALVANKDELSRRMHRLVHNEVEVVNSLVFSQNESKRMKQLRQKLLLAGLHTKGDLDRTIRIQRICNIFPFAMMLFFFFMGFSWVQIALSGALFAVFFILIPKFLLIRSITKRRREIERFLPDTLDLLTLCLEAGLSFDTSLVRVAEEQEKISKQISREFKMTNDEILAGEGREDALKHLAWRTGIEDIKTLTEAIIQSVKLGTSLVKTLRTQSQVIRKKRRERIRALILKTPVKLIFPLLLFIFPTLVIIILGPSLVTIFRELSKVAH